MMTREALDQAARNWWYYTVELAPGVVAQGTYPPDFPYLPRMLMRRADLRGADCLDLGTMEGALAVLMHRKGARRIVATDALPHCVDKMALLQEVYRAQWEFRETGLMYNLSEKLVADGLFDFVNLSGVLNHVYSPLHTLASTRPLLKKNGLLLVSTNVVNEQSHRMHFNTAGRLQKEANTFWYPSITLLEYLLCYFNLAPLDCLFSRHPSNSMLYVPGMECGNLSVICRAVEPAAALPADDEWARRSMMGSWEYLSQSKQRQGNAEPVSTTTYEAPAALAESPTNRDSIDIYLAVNESGRRVVRAQDARDTYLLQLGDES